MRYGRPGIKDRLLQSDFVLSGMQPQVLPFQRSLMRSRIDHFCSKHCNDSRPTPWCFSRSSSSTFTLLQGFPITIYIYLFIPVTLTCTTHTHQTSNHSTHSCVCFSTRITSKFLNQPTLSSWKLRDKFEFVRWSSLPILIYRRTRLISCALPVS
jgi:hypothetical protein